MNTLHEIKDWLHEKLNQGKFSYRNNLDRFTEINEDKKYVKVILHTSENAYYITATLDGYLGCIVSSRKAELGEKHLRGADLADGKLNEETLSKIVYDILAYEIVS